MELRSYQRRWVTVEAVQVSDDNLDGVARWVAGSARGDVPWCGTDHRGVQALTIANLGTGDGEANAAVGDWVVLYPEDGTFHVFDQVGFEQRFVT